MRIAVLLMSLAIALSMTTTTVFAEISSSEATGSAAASVSETDPAATEATQTAETKKKVPAVPKIKVTIKGSGLRIKWNKIEGARSYAVYRSYKKSSGYKLLKKGIKRRYYVDKTVKSGKRAYYKVRALKKGGKHSKFSKPRSGKIFRVYIETGHGTGHDGVWDPGCIWSKYQEAKLMVPISKSFAKHLRAKGVYVYTDAFGNNNRNLIVTLRHVKKEDVSVLVNVHCDYQYAPKGTLPLYRYSDQKELAKCLNKGVHKYVKINDRGLCKRTDLDTLNKSVGYCVACLFETGNIKKDNTILRKKYDAYGKGLARGVCDYLGVEW